LVEFCVLGALTVIEVPESGAVTRPAVLMVPPVMDHVYPEEKVPVPRTFAVQFSVAPSRIDAEAQLSEIPVTALADAVPDDDVVVGVVTEITLPVFCVSL